MVDANIYDLISKNHQIEKCMDDIWIFILIIIILFIFKIKSLLFQYFLIILIMFIYSPIYGLLYGNLIFYLYNYNIFNICNNFIFYSLISGIIFNLFFIFYLKIYSKKINTYFTTPLIILISLCFNVYFLFYYSNIMNEEKKYLYKKIDDCNIGGTKTKTTTPLNSIETFCKDFNFYKKTI